MPKKPSTRNLGFCIPKAMLKRVDAFAAKQSDKLGFKVSRSDALRMLLTRGLKLNRL